MKKFRLPRKAKKFLKGNLWLYPADDKGGSLMASLGRSQEDYDAVKQGVVRDILDRESKTDRKEINKRLNLHYALENLLHV